jgi:hypothetical protein
MQDASGCDATGHGRKGYAGYPPPQRGNESTATRRARLAYLSPRVRKSDKALAFERSAFLQIPAECRRWLTGPVRVTMRIFYASERPDLDESVLLDVLQDRYRTLKTKGRTVRELVCAGVYRNDRQVREKHIYHGIDRANPCAEIVIEPMHAQQSELQL